MFRIAPLFLICVGTLFAAPKHTVLAVFAHPDDESVVGPLLAKCADEGHNVHLAIITSGQMGNANTDIPKGDQLGAAREQEARCSCKALGIHPPLLLRFMDGGICSHEAIPKIVERVREVFDEVEPDVVITWGPDGLSGHPDHRTATNAVTQVFQERRKLRHNPRKLYYAAWPESRLKELPESLRRWRSLRWIADEFVTTEVKATQYVEQTYRSMQCHKTQWTQERIDQNRKLFQTVLAGSVFLRLALTDLPFPNSRETDIFAGLE